MKESGLFGFALFLSGKGFGIHLLRNNNFSFFYWIFKTIGAVTLSTFTLLWEIQASDDGKMVRQFLQEKNISKTALTDIKFKGGRIMVNGEEVTVRKLLKQGDSLKVEFPEERRSEGMKGEKIPLNILYEDDFVLVVLKPAAMNIIPSREHPTGSLANALAGYYEQTGLESTTHIVTRLDRDTSGIVLVAKHRHIHHLLSQEQRTGEVKRTYEAFVQGCFEEPDGTIDKPIARKKESIIEREVHPEGQRAVTHYHVKKQYSDFAHVELQLETGRTHQIRVHLSSIGHPLLGDDLYGGSLAQIGRQALHCRRIAFYHPFLEKTLIFEAPLPEDMRRLVK
jgi:23S rRNA pseudouridine1911/1915/1917 synthase